jgi:gas vesicle protein
VNALMRIANFAGGALLGTAIGSAAAAFLAPQSGPELQQFIRERIDEAKRAREAAEKETQERLWEKYRGEFPQTDAQSLSQE